jgi:formate hydrogenlyase subunit 3/multisubunit Na+/H+ antiporter MnhD subunit
MTMLSGEANAVFLSYDLFNIFVAVDLSTILGFLLIRNGKKTPPDLVVHQYTSS